MHLVTYISRARIREDKLDEELDALVRKAAEHNAAHNITGALLLLADNFIQVIEGDRVTLHALLARIEQDPRHHEMRILLDEEVETRTFPQWSMELFVESDGARNVAANFADMVAAYSRLVTPQARSLVSLIKTAVENPALVATFSRKSMG